MFNPSSLILGFKDNPKSIAYLGFPKMTSSICSVEEPEKIGIYFPALFLETPSGTDVTPDQRAIFALVQTSSLYY